MVGIDELAPAGAPSCAVRLDGAFELVRARSVPAQALPYRPLTEVVADQHVFELANLEGTMLGFRFPTWVEGIEVAGYHLHFISADRTRQRIEKPLDATKVEELQTGGPAAWRGNLKFVLPSAQRSLVGFLVGHQAKSGRWRSPSSDL